MICNNVMREVIRTYKGLQKSNRPPQIYQLCKILDTPPEVHFHVRPKHWSRSMENCIALSNRRILEHQNQGHDFQDMQHRYPTHSTMESFVHPSEQWT
mmetsp:Transcript_10509/g.21398  ORF Transcript_10509/g.21398 Transcript_10509/m.21398 type:complete len:98 (-) Transcript_10509:341-634(-)